MRQKPPRAAFLKWLCRCWDGDWPIHIDFGGACVCLTPLKTWQLVRPRSPSVGCRARQPCSPAVPGGCKEKQLCSLRAGDSQSSSSLLERTALCRFFPQAAVASPGGSRRSGPPRSQRSSPAPEAPPPASPGREGGRRHAEATDPPFPTETFPADPRAAPDPEPPRPPRKNPRPPLHGRPTRSPPRSARPRRPGSGSRPAGSASQPAPSNRPGRRVAKGGLWGRGEREGSAAGFLPKRPWGRSASRCRGPRPGCERRWVPTPRWVPTARPGRPLCQRGTAGLYASALMYSPPKSVPAF